MADLDMDKLVEVGARALHARDPTALSRDWFGDPPEFRDRWRADARAILAAVLPLLLEGPREALAAAKIALNVAANDAHERDDEELRHRCAKACNDVAQALATIDSLLGKGG